jgi:hypothetical protein
MGLVAEIAAARLRNFRNPRVSARAYNARSFGLSEARQNEWV